MIDAAIIAAEARAWVGTRWHHQASLRGVGTDCIGLVVGVAAACGIREASEFRAAPEYQGYGRQPDPEVLIAGCDRWLAPLRLSESRLGDILVMRFREEPQHFALISREYPTYIVHAFAQARRVVEHRLDDIWRARIVRAYRFRGVA